MSFEVLEREEQDKVNYVTEKNIEVEKVKIKVRDIFNGYENKEGKTIGYNGKLNIRPEFQREFIYNPEQEEAVIHSVLDGFPLSLIYWGETENGYDLIDGQQRTLSIMRFISNKYAIRINYIGHKKISRTFEELSEEERNSILNYELDIALLKGTPDSKLKYFEIINTAGEKLNNQEMINAAYHGLFINQSRNLFSNKKSEFFTEAGADGNWINFIVEKDSDIKRQLILEKMLKWVSLGKGKTIEEYVSQNRENNSEEFKAEILKILKWSKETFAPESKDYYDWMKKVKWAEVFYENEKKKAEDKVAVKYEDIPKRIKELSAMPGIDKNEGIPMFLVTGEEKYLNSRSFNKKDIINKWKEQDKKCASCGEAKDEDQIAGDHIVSWSKGGRTEYENLQVLCKRCNSSKSNG